MSGVPLHLHFLLRFTEMQRILILYLWSIYNHYDYLLKLDFWHQQDWDLQTEGREVPVTLEQPRKSHLTHLFCTRENEKPKLVGYNAILCQREDSVLLKAFPLIPLDVRAKHWIIIRSSMSSVSIRTCPIYREKIHSWILGKQNVSLSTLSLSYFMFYFPKYGCCFTKVGVKSPLRILYLLHTSANVGSMPCFAIICVSLGKTLCLFTNKIITWKNISSCIRRINMKQCREDSLEWS